MYRPCNEDAELHAALHAPSARGTYAHDEPVAYQQREQLHYTPEAALEELLQEQEPWPHAQHAGRYLWPNSLQDVPCAPLLSSVKPEDCAHTPGPSWLGGRPPRSPSHYTWVDTSANASLAISHASTWSDDLRRTTRSTSDGDTRHVEWAPVAQREVDAGWAALGAAYEPLALTPPHSRSASVPVNSVAVRPLTLPPRFSGELQEEARPDGGAADFQARLQQQARAARKALFRAHEAAAPRAPPEPGFADFISVFLQEPQGLGDAEPLAQPLYAQHSPWGDAGADPFAVLDARGASGAAFAVASAPHRREAYDRWEPDRGAAVTHHSAARYQRHTVTGGYAAQLPRGFGGNADAMRLHASARLFDEREREQRSVLVGGAAVVLTGQLQQPNVGCDGYIRKDDLLGDIIRVGGGRSGRGGASGGASAARERTLQEKVAAVSRQDAAGARSSNGGDSTHGGSTTRKRKAAAAIELRALALDGSHHSTGRGSARRKARVGSGWGPGLGGVVGEGGEE